VTQTPPFTGPESLRVPGEWSTFFWTLASLPVTIVILGWLFQHQITWQELALLLVLAMIYVAFARGRLLGGGVRVHAGQFAHVHAIVEECARMLRMPVPHVFIRDDPFVPCVAVGIGEPYAIVISAQYVDHFADDELRFLIGRELGHIASGHTRYTSLLSANGRENAIVSVAFGAWLRRIEYTADRVGLLCCSSLDSAVRAIAVSSFGHIGRKIDLGAFAEQLREISAEPSLRMGEWSGSNPYATNRIAALHRFARDPLYQRWAQRFAQNAQRPVELEQRQTVYAGFWRRVWALTIDVVLIQILVPAAGNVIQTVKSGRTYAPNLKDLDTDSDVPAAVKTAVHQVANVAAQQHAHVYTFAPVQGPELIVMFVYAVILVGLVGQTFGMMVSDLRVTGPERHVRIGLGAAFSRYVGMTISLFMVFGWFSIFRHIQPYERWSKTRLISGAAPVRS